MLAPMLTQADIASFLLERRLVEPATVVDGRFTVRDASSRNRNYRVEASPGPSYLLKQGVGAAGETVGQEAGVYAALADGGAVGRYLPRFYGYDQDERVLVLELVPDAEDLREYHLKGRFPASLGTAVGAALGTLHRETWIAAPRAAPEAAPWILTLHRPELGIFRDVSAANLEVIKIVQRTPRFGDRLDELRAGWRKEALIHQDVKWDNCLVVAGERGRKGVKLIDWEAAAYGDPCWDIGSALGHYLSFWLFSIPITGPVPPQRFPELAAFPLDSMQRALGACWDAYVRSLRLGPVEAGERLRRSAGFAAVRLVQTAFEATQLLPQVTSGVVLHLQLAFNILERPVEAAVRLLGLPRPLREAA